MTTLRRGSSSANSAKLDFFDYILYLLHKADNQRLGKVKRSLFIDLKYNKIKCYFNHLHRGVQRAIMSFKYRPNQNQQGQQPISTAHVCRCVSVCVCSHLIVPAGKVSAVHLILSTITVVVTITLLRGVNTSHCTIRC